VGLDPRWDLLPLDLRQRHDDGKLNGVAHACEEFCLRVLDLVAPLVPVVKPQSAFFEACGPAGMSALQRILAKARQLQLITILDGKRNDIAATATAYAEAALSAVKVNDKLLSVWGADSLTVNPYLGRDAVEPFITCARRSQGGLFVLVRTSNPGAGLFQDLRCESSGSTKPLYQLVGEAVAVWSDENLAECGFGDVGAVVGATHPDELAQLRQMLPRVVFLVPGYGAQGGSAADTAAAFRADGLGAIVNSSRGIIASFAPQETDWPDAVVNATKAAITDLASATPMGQLAKFV